MNAIANEINDDLATAEQEVAAADVMLTESSIMELKDFCKTIEVKIDGSYREAATKYARMDVRRTANAMTVMEGNIASYKARIRQLLADLRKARSTSAPLLVRMDPLLVFLRPSTAVPINLIWSVSNHLRSRARSRTSLSSDLCGENCCLVTPRMCKSNMSNRAFLLLIRDVSQVSELWQKFGNAWRRFLGIRN